MSLCRPGDENELEMEAEWIYKYCFVESTISKQVRTLFCSIIFVLNFRVLRCSGCCRRNRRQFLCDCVVFVEQKAPVLYRKNTGGNIVQRF